VTGAAPATEPMASSAPGRRRLLVLVAAAVAVVVFAVAASTILGGPGRKVETGIVVSVEATGLTAVQGFSIRTTDERTVDFRIGTLENASTFPPGHLAEHKVSLVPVVVTYVDEGGDRVAVRIEDAP
jgi:hypothetical protein